MGAGRAVDLQDDAVALGDHLRDEVDAPLLDHDMNTLAIGQGSEVVLVGFALLHENVVAVTHLSQRSSCHGGWLGAVAGEQTAEGERADADIPGGQCTTLQSTAFQSTALRSMRVR